MRRIFLPLVALSLCVVGCQTNRELQQAILDVKNEHKLTLMLLDEQDKFLEGKLNDVQDKLGILDDSNRRLSENFSRYARRPDEIKREILDDVGLRTIQIAEEQQKYLADLTARLEQHASEFENRMMDATESTEKALSEEDAFFRFVFTEQDSINRVFAARFENRPWYESVLSRWEERSPTPN